MLPLPCETLMSEKKRLATNYEKDFLMSLSVKKNLIGEYLVKLQARTWLSRALSSSCSSMVARRTKCTGNHLLACITLPNIHRFKE